MLLPAQAASLLSPPVTRMEEEEKKEEVGLLKKGIPDHLAHAVVVVFFFYTQYILSYSGNGSPSSGVLDRSPRSQRATVGCLIIETNSAVVETGKKACTACSFSD